MGEKRGDVWDRYAAAYFKIIELSSLYSTLMDKAATYLQSCKRVLDVGCGTGNLLKRLTGELYGIDTNLEMLRFAKQQLPNATLLFQDAVALKFNDGSFDGVSCINMLYYVDEPNKVLKETHRVLKPNGILVVAGPKPNIDYGVLEGNFKQDLAKISITPELSELIEIFKACNKELIQKAMKNTYEVEELEEILLRIIGFKRIIHVDNTLYLGQDYFIVAEK